MASLNLDGEPIFVDVAIDQQDQQFPILYSHLLASTDENDTSIVEPPKANNIVSSNNEPTVLQPQNETSTETQTNRHDQTELTKTFIKIENRKLKCPECKRFTCETEEKMVRHIRKVHRGENPFQCYMCEYSTYNKAVFEEHVRVHQGIKPFQCSYCDYKSSSKKNTKKHETRHRADNPLKCPDCEFIARNPQSFKSHQSKEHAIHNIQKNENDGKVYSCKLCAREFLTSKQRSNHFKMRKKCSECAYVTCSKMLFDTHMQVDHGINVPKKEIPKLFTCALCPWSSSSKPRILLHLIHHPNQTVNEDSIDISVLKNCGIMK